MSKQSTATVYTAKQANMALVLLLLAYVLSFIDRNVMAVLIGPIRQDFDISDFQYSLLHGFAFSMFYIALGLPIARLADRYPRLNIISIGIVVWSAMTVACGLVKNFGALFVARMGVGVGEAALSPAAFSIFSDIYSPEKLPKATAVYSLGITLGGGLAYILGGAIYEYFVAFEPIQAGFLGEIKAWQLTFIAVGLPGFVVALALKLLPEPPRKQSELTPASTGLPLSEVWAFFKSNARLYVGIIGSMSLMSVVGYGVMAWYPEMLIRIYGVDRSVAGTQFGTVFIISGSIGTLAGGWMCSWLMQRGVIDAPLRIIVFVCVLWGIPVVYGPLSGHADIAIATSWAIVLFLNAYFGVGVTAVALVTPNAMRAQASAVLLFFTNLFGLAFGPSAVAMLTDFVFADDAALNASLALLPALVFPPALALALLARKPYVRAVQTRSE